MLQQLGFNDLPFDNVEEGKYILLEKLSYAQVFIVLDDIDHQDHLESLLPMKDSLEEGSVIIVTSRKSDILISWGIPSTSIYKIKELNPEHTMELFCWHAFQQPSPMIGFESLVNKFSTVCKGLPLSLKVLGGLVREKSVEYWDAQLDKVSRVLHKDIKDTLKVSFDALDEEEREIFLDISCFLIGEEKQLAVTVWDGFGWSGLHSLETLESKCLVEVDERSPIRMHDHLRDLGKEIARKKSPYRLCSPQHIRDIEIEVQENMLCRGIRGIRAETDEFYEECMELVRVSGTRFKRRLEIMIVKNNYFTEELAALSAGPVWLRWVNFPQTALQPWLSLKKLRILELHDADKLEQLWNETTDPPVQLRELIISNAPRFLRFPSSIGCLQHLTKIFFSSKGYDEEVPIEGLPDEFCRLRSLEHIKLRSKKLKSLPFKLGDLRNLRHLDLSGCSGLTILPASFKHLIHLQHINLSGCSELSFRSDILENMTKLETLNFSGCLKLQKLPPHTTNQGSLKVLDVGFGRLRKLPNSIGQLTKLEKLTIGGILRTLPPSIESLSSLTVLTITRCDELEYLPESLGKLFSLSRLRISRCAKLTSLPYSLVLLISLQSLHIQECPIMSLDILSGWLPSLLYNLKDISVRETFVSRISISHQCCPSLETLELRENYQLVEIDSLPASIKTINLNACSMLKSVGRNCVLQHLKSLVIQDCGQRLHELPNFSLSVSLEEFQIIRSARQLKKIQGLEYCRSLKTLKVHTCWKMPAIQSLENMDSLRRLELSGWKLSALEPCLRTIKKWPSECIICTRTAPGVDAVLKSLTFPGLTLVNSCVRRRGLHYTAENLTVKCGKWHSSNEAMMMCFVINSDSEFTDVHMLIPPLLTEKLILSKGTWVWLGVYTHSSRFAGREEYMLSKHSYSLSYRTPPPAITGEYLGRLILDMVYPPDHEGLGMLVMGEEKRVVEAFYQLLQHFGGSM
ncbi:hypothetical protein SUGI_0344080 [Cryptomeria japonica]|uniref:disease resistance protein Roq1 isoform X2 n=1 Tax=Cryptomeria japonica TaxID=3369 RepID=UPI002408D260|nr:disease resistance protein Roq1 isoform X2 [Cryptomeria japonica]GLJ19158.1 hypothetical protein SUGI_0344080 [Cryptomeria japonica]